MSIICPTVTAFDIASFKKQLSLVSSISNRVHIDLMDGIFTTTKSPSIHDIQFADNLVIDFHVMYQDPSIVLMDLVKFKPNLIILHHESNADIPLIAADLRRSKIKTGIALLSHTEVDKARFVLPHVQHALIFAGSLGYHGGQADLNMLDKISEINKYQKYLEIGWDGGVNEANCELLTNKGIDVLNVGGAIHNADNPKMSYSKLCQLVASS